MSGLNFKEIPEAHKIGAGLSDSFELFARAFIAEVLKWRIVDEPSRGADGGKDLIAEEVRPGRLSSTKVRWLVSCKHKAHSGDSVTPSDEQDLRDRLERFDCKGLMPVYSTLASTGLAQKFDALKAAGYEVELFHVERLCAELVATPEGLKLSKRYMPLSTKAWLELNSKSYKVHLENEDINALLNLRERHSVEFRQLEIALSESKVTLHVSPYLWAELFSESKGEPGGKDRFAKKRELMRRLGIRPHDQPATIIASDLYAISPVVGESLPEFTYRFRACEIAAFVAYIKKLYKRDYCTDRLAEELSSIIKLNDLEVTALKDNLRYATENPGPSPDSRGPEVAVLHDMLSSMEASEELAAYFIQESVLSFENKQAKLYANLEVDNLPNTERHCSRGRLEQMARTKGSFEQIAFNILEDIAPQWGITFSKIGHADLKGKLPHIRAMLSYYYGRNGTLNLGPGTRDPKKKVSERRKQMTNMIRLLYAPDCDLFSAHPTLLGRVQTPLLGVTRLAHGKALWQTILRLSTAVTKLDYSGLVTSIGRCYSC